MRISKEAKIGLTGIVAIVILYLGVTFLKGMTLFGSDHKYYISFHNAKGLTNSSSVYADGYQIGVVSNISYDYDKPGEVVIEISVDNDVRIPQGTTAQLAEGMLGGCTLNMTMGTNPKVAIAPGDTIIGSDGSGLMAKAEEMLPQVEQVVAHVDSLINTLNRVASDPNIQKTLENAEALTANLNNSSAQLNVLLGSQVPALLKTFDAVGKNAEQMTQNLASLNMQQTLDQVNTTISDVQQLIALLQSPEGNLGQLLNDTLLYHNLNTTIGSANSLLQDLQAHPKRYVHFSVFGKKDN